MQFLPKIGLINSSGHDEVARVSAEAVLQQEHRTTGLRKADTLGPGSTLQWPQDEGRIQDKERGCNTGDGQGHSSSYTHANGIALVQQLP